MGKNRFVSSVTPEVLIIDDSLTMRAQISKFVEGLGWIARTAENGAQGMDEIKAKKPDVIICDMEMPVINGLGVIRAVRADLDTMFIPFILLTSIEEKDLKLMALELGVDEFLQKPPDLSELKARLQNLVQLKMFTDQLEDAESVLFAISEIVEARDWFTGKHCQRLSDYSVALGSHLGLSPKELDALRKAGHLHDIGKIAVPDAVLLKKGPLDEEEWIVVRRHPEVGEQVCRNMRTINDVLPIIRHHHEQWNGGGYPDKLKGEKIPLLARVLQVVDIYDALRSQRAYKPALSFDEAIRTLREESAEGKRDPQIVEAFLEIAAESNEIEESYAKEKYANQPG